MQVATITLRHAGRLDTQISKVQVTPAEVILLRALHGQDAVTVETITGEAGRDSAEERDRLDRLYGSVSAANMQTLERIFPGYNAKLPASFAEIGIQLAEPKRKAGAPAAKGANAALEALN